MFIPVPVLIVAGLVVLLLLALILRPRRRDPLMGGQPRIARASKPALVVALPPETEAQVRALLAAGRKIEAIKVARDATHLGLKQTKDLVESLER